MLLNKTILQSSWRRIIACLSLAVAVPWVFLLSCGGSKKPVGVASDAGVELPPPPADAGQIEEATLPAGRGKVELVARWLWPPAAMRRSPGRNSCGRSRRPYLATELMGGVQDTALLAPTGEPPASATIHVDDCQLEPRVSTVGVGNEIVVRNRGQARVEVVVERLGEGNQGVVHIGGGKLHLPGQGVSLRLDQPGTLRLHTASDPTDHAYVIVTEGAAAVTDARGVAAVEIPVGNHEFALWHPPKRGETKALKTTIRMDVKDKVRSKQTVDLNR